MVVLKWFFDGPNGRLAERHSGKMSLANLRRSVFLPPDVQPAETSVPVAGIRLAVVYHKKGRKTKDCENDKETDAFTNVCFLSRAIG